MFTLTSSHQYYLYKGITDMRKRFDGLCWLIKSKLLLDPLSGEVFIFINKRRNQIKLLHWKQGGFILYYKRLESGTFELSSFDNDHDCSHHLSCSELVILFAEVPAKVGRHKR